MKMASTPDERRAAADPVSAFLDRIATRQARVGVVGLGYVGLPLVLRFAEEGFEVLGFDVDPRKVEALNAGRSYIHHIKAETVSAARFRPAKPLAATADFDRLSEADAIIVCVPTPLDDHREPDLRYIDQTAESIARVLRPGQLVVLESTTYPGTTDERLLTRFSAGGMQVGRDFFLAFSPEREDPGNPKFSTRTIPKVVGGTTPACREAAVALYQSVIDKVVPVSSTRAAELTKLLENIYRSVNIALVNELKVLCDRMGLDIWEVIDAAKTKPFGFTPFYPGPGLGGHCIPIDPFYLTWKAREYDFATRFIELAGEINAGMPEYVVRRIVDALSDKGKGIRGAKILVLGVAYKKDVDDQRESPSLKLIELLKGRGAEVSYHDPYVPVCRGHRHYPDLELKSVPMTDEFLRSVDCVLIATDHSNVDYGRVVALAPLVVDTRNAAKNVQHGREKIVKA